MALARFLRRNGVAIGIALYVLGFFVHSKYLALFGIAQYQLIQARYIFTGFVMVLFYGYAVLGLIARTNPTARTRPRPLLGFAAWIGRLLAVANVAGIFVLREESWRLCAGNGIVPDFMVKTFNGSFMLFNFIVAIWMLVDIAWPPTGQIDEWFRRVVDIANAAILVFLLPYAVAAVKCHLPLIHIYAFFAWLALYYVMLGYASLSPSTWNDVLVLPKEAPDQVQSLARKYMGYVTMFGLLITSANLYSRQIYPYMSATFGGAASYKVNVVVKDGNIRGLLISESESRLYIAKEDSSGVTELPWSAVERVEIEKPESTRGHKR